MEPKITQLKRKIIFQTFPPPPPFLGSMLICQGVSISVGKYWSSDQVDRAVGLSFCFSFVPRHPTEVSVALSIGVKKCEEFRIHI